LTGLYVLGLYTTGASLASTDTEIEFCEIRVG